MDSYHGHICEDCNRAIPARQVEEFSVDVHGVDEHGDPRRMDVPRCCDECADWWAGHRGDDDVPPPPWRVEPVPPRCCEAMVRQLDLSCEQHGTSCPDRLVLRTTTHPSGGRWLLVARNAEYDFEFCPWCGSRFQEPDGLGTGTRRLWT